MTERLHFLFSPSCIEEGNGNPLQCSCLESPRDGGAWWAAIYGVAQSQTRLRWLSSSSRSEWSSGFPYFPQFKSEFGNKEFMIWATVSSWFCLCWLYRVSPPLAAKNIINLILVLTIWWCPCAESSLVLLEEGVCYDQCVFLAKLYWSLPCFIPHSKAKVACYSRCFFSSYLCIPLPYFVKDIFWGS